MGFKDILLTLDTDPGCARRLAYAAELARQHEARLIGLFVVEPLNLSVYFSPAVSGYIAADAMAEIEQQHRTAAEASARKVEATFRDACSRAGVTAEWRFAEGDTADTGVLHARHVDLAVTGQVDPEKPPPGSAAWLPEQLALASGRPVLVFPYAGTFDTVGRSVLVAWSRTRESARALNDALPILERAEIVRVLSINPEQDGSIAGADISLHLAHHGVKAEAASTIAKDIDVGNTLLSRAADYGSDLIVMGCYGHSRAREFMLGGATREILRHMTVPVLMSH